jgi:phage gpG-like protein
MKTLIKTIVCVLLFNTSINAQSQQKIEMRIDSIGNAKLAVSMTMNAQQWQVWNSNYGNNPSALKRDIERSMPAYFLDNFKLEKDDMNRSFNLSLNAYGVCEINKRGKWIVDTDQKNAQLTELTGNKYMLVSSPPEYGGNLQQTFIVELPNKAKNIKTDKDAYGKSVFEFDMDAPSSGFNMMRWSGVFLLIIGGGWLGKDIIKNNNRKLIDDDNVLSK